MKRHFLPAAFLLFCFVALSGQSTGPISVDGEVVRFDGKPLANAQIVFTSSKDGASYRCSTGPDGKFQLPGLPAGSYNVVVDGPDETRVHSSQKDIFAGGETFFRLVEISSAITPVKAAWDPLKEAGREQARHVKWLKVTHTTPPDLDLADISRLGGRTALITEYRTLQPEANTAINRRDWQLASRLLQRMIEIAPEKWELYQSLGISQRNLEQYKESIATFEKGLQLVRQDPEAKSASQKIKTAMASMFQGEGESYFALGDMHAAAAQFRHAAELDPDPALAYIRLCSAEYNSGNDDQAVAACNKAIEADPGEIRFYQVLAGIESNLARYKEAIRDYQAGIRTARREMGLVKNISSNINSRSSAEITGADRYNRQIGQMLFGEANAYFSLKEYKQAAALFSESADTYPAPALAYFNRCAALYDLGDLNGASEACNNAITLDRGMAEAYFAKGSAESAMAAQHGRFAPPQHAIAALKKYLELSPEGLYSERARRILDEAGIR